MSHSSSENRSEVASPCSVCRRQMKPGLASATALIGWRLATKSASCGESSGAASLAMLDLCHVEAGHRADPNGSDPSPRDARIASTSSAARSKRPNCGMR